MKNTWGKPIKGKKYFSAMRKIFSDANFYKSHILTDESINNIVIDADKISEHTFNFLGTGLVSWGKEINWSKDVISTHVWDSKIYFEYNQAETILIENVDIKIPWELNRLQHLVVLGQAWRVSKNEKYVDEIFNQLDHWQTNNPFCYGINWLSTMEVSIRAVNIMFTMDLISDSELFKSKISNITSLIEDHGKFIQNNLEIGISNGSIVAGNHLLANFSALFMIGMIFDQIDNSKKWRKAGMKGLNFCMDFMVFEDGFFFETSTSYHRFATELFLFPYIVSRKLDFEFEKFYISKLEKMFEFIHYTVDFDGTIPIIGDNDDGRLLILNDYYNWKKDDYRYLLDIGAYIFDRADFQQKSLIPQNELIWIFKEYKNIDYGSSENFKRKSKDLSESGFYLIIDEENRNYALTKLQNFSKNSPSAHSHYDMLSLALTHFGRKIFIDAGSFCYTLSSKKRNLFRSSFYHNVVTLNNSDIHSLSLDAFKMNWAGIKVELINWEVNGDNIIFVGQHNGYQRDYGCHIRRSIKYSSKLSKWKIIDEVIGDVKKINVIKSQWLLAEGIIPKYNNIDECGSLIYIDQKSGINFKFENHQNITIKQHDYSPSYGEKKKTLMISTNIPINSEKIIASLSIW